MQKSVHSNSKVAFSPVKGAIHPCLVRRKASFTLAEVLITLGLIGVIAAMTMPSLILNYQKEKTLSYVKKFYNEINNALRMAAVENGDVDLWMPEPKSTTYVDNLDFVQKYLLPYIKYFNYNNCYSNRVCVFLTYGMFTFYADTNGGDVAFYVNSKRELNPKNYFLFQFNKKNDNSNLSFKPVVEPYALSWDGEYSTLKTDGHFGCNHTASSPYAYCTKWIQMNNWKIPDDYPWEIK